jgi:hypothetical protein
LFGGDQPPGLAFNLEVQQSALCFHAFDPLNVQLTPAGFHIVHRLSVGEVHSGLLMLAPNARVDSGLLL